MNPDEYIAELCTQYGVSTDFGTRMLPLARRAERVRPEMRLRLRAFIERSFAAQKKREDEEPSLKLRPGDGRVLGTVANVLHDWNPPAWLNIWADRLRKGSAKPPRGEAG